MLRTRRWCISDVAATNADKSCINWFFLFLAPSLGFVAILIAKIPMQNFSAVNGVANLEVQIITKAVQKVLAFVIIEKCHAMAEPPHSRLINATLLVHLQSEGFPVAFYIVGVNFNDAFGA